VEKVLEEEKEENLRRHSLQIWERDVICLHMKLFSGRVEEPNLQIKQKYMNNLSGPKYKKIKKKKNEVPRTKGSSIVKWEKSTCFVHAHCSAAVGTLLGCSFHLRK
jgi:hypothetical protein